MTMELGKYLLPLRRWWWLLLTATLVAAVSSYIATLQQAPVYQARTTLMTGQAIYDPNPTTNEFVLSQELAGNYADIANREPIRVATMRALGLSRLPEYTASAVPNGQFIEILVKDTDPEQAQAVANELANQLVNLGPSSVQGEDQNHSEFVQQQLNTLEVQIVDTQNTIEEVQQELATLVSASQIADTQNRLNALQNKLTSMQNLYADLLATTQSGALNTLTIIELATVPRRPIGPDKALIVLMAAAIGFGLAASAAYILEYLDNALKTKDEITEVLEAPIIGVIADVGDDHEDDKEVFVTKHPRSPTAEAFRSLRTNLEFSAVDEPVKTILVSSPETGVGKTMVAANLAEIMAHGDNKVVLIDADLHKPRIHKYLGLSNKDGLTDIFRDRLDVYDVGRIFEDRNLAVITTGSLPPNPAELLGSRKMSELLSKLKDIADFVIIDGPPFVVTDASVLAAKVDGVLLVIRPNFTQKASARAMVEQIKRVGAKTLGVVLNRVPAKSFGQFGSFPYAYNYYAANGYYGEKGADGEEPAVAHHGQTLIGRLQAAFSRNKD